YLSEHVYEHNTTNKTPTKGKARHHTWSGGVRSEGVGGKFPNHLPHTRAVSHAGGHRKEHLCPTTPAPWSKPKPPNTNATSPGKSTHSPRGTTPWRTPPGTRPNQETWCGSATTPSERASPRGERPTRSPKS